jgi:hypothetical protein
MLTQHVQYMEHLEMVRRMVKALRMSLMYMENSEEFRDDIPDVVVEVRAILAEIDGKK